MPRHPAVALLLLYRSDDRGGTWRNELSDSPEEVVLSAEIEITDLAGANMVRPDGRASRESP
jgi:hypothetical protein